MASNGGRIKQQDLGNPIHEKSPSLERLRDRNKDTIRREDREESSKMASISTSKHANARRDSKIAEKDSSIRAVKHNRQRNYTSTRMDSILSVLASNAELSSKRGQILLRGDSTTTHMLPTQNSLQKDPFDINSVI